MSTMTPETTTTKIRTVFPLTAFTPAQWELIEQGLKEGQDVDHILSLDPWSHDVESMLARVVRTIP